jgi:hypothetical protein
MPAAEAGQPPVITLLNPATGATFDFRGRWLRNSPATERDVRMGRAKFRGDKVYLPLPPGVQAQLDKGVLEFASVEDQATARRVSAAADEPSEPLGHGGIPMPPARAPHEMWVDYAIAMGMDPETAAALSRDQIKAAFAPAVEAARHDEPFLEVLDEDTAARAARRGR